MLTSASFLLKTFFEVMNKNKNSKQKILSQIVLSEFFDCFYFFYSLVILHCMRICFWWGNWGSWASLLQSGLRCALLASGFTVVEARVWQESRQSQLQCQLAASDLLLQFLAGHCYFHYLEWCLILGAGK